MMAHGVHVRTRLENLAVDHALRIRPLLGWDDRIGVEVVFEDVISLHQGGCARTREKVALRIVRIAHADVSEGIENALVSDDPVCDRKIAAQLCERIGHETFPVCCLQPGLSAAKSGASGPTFGSRLSFCSSRATHGSKAE